jgi:2-dehydro-3-deoxygluconokinase
MFHKVVTFGEMMLRLSAPGHCRFEQATSFDASFAGAEGNVAASLATFGVPVQFVTRLPDNDIGRKCANTFRRHRVGVDHVVWGGERLGLFYLETGAVQRGSQVIYDRAHSSFSALEPGVIDWRRVFADAVWFHWTGITPAVSSSAAKSCLEAVLVAKELGLTVSCDLNYRAKLWQWGKTPREVMEELVGHCDLVVANEEDAEQVFGMVAPDVEIDRGEVDAQKYIVVCEQMVAAFPSLRTVAVTLRGSLSASHNTWSGMLWRDGEVYFAPVYDIVPIVDRVGAGDAFNGALIYGLGVADRGPQWALDFAVAASCLKHTVHGDFNLVTVAEVEKLAAGNASGRVVR